MTSIDPECVWQRGGARVHRIYLTWPFALLRISEAALELQVLFWRWRLPARDVREIRRITGLTTKGIEIEHTIADAPAAPVFWSFDIKSLERALRDAGWEVVG